jgi:multiple sugar transport system substrate-binding protein
MKRTPAVIGALVLAPIFLTSACSSGGGAAAAASAADFSAKPTGTLHAWAFDNADDVGKARMASVAKQLQGVKTTYDETEFDVQKFTTRLAAGNVPDVVQMKRQYVATYAAQGLIMPVDKCFSANKVDPKKQYYPSVLDDVRYQGHLWGVPQFYQPMAIMLDENTLKAAGVTNDEIDTSKPATLLKAITKMYKQQGGKPTVLGFDPEATENPNMWLLGLGGKLVGKDGAPTLDDPANVYPLSLLKKITDAQGGYAKLKSLSDSFDAFGAGNPYVKNQVGAQLNSQWYPNVLSAYKDKVSLATVPFRDRNGKPVTMSDGEAFVIPAKSKNPAAACAWALDLTSQQNWMAAAAARAQTLAKSGGINTGLFTGSPATDKAIRDKYLKPSGDAGFDQTDNAFYDIVPDGISFGSSPAGQAIKTDLSNAITSVLLGQQTPKKALAAAQTAAMRSYDTTAH